MAHQGRSSPAEAEFRAYMILLNLNDTIRAMKKLAEVPSHLRLRPCIVRARNILNAFISGNYSIFFRLVRQATQLEASVLFRFFNEVRGDALRSIVHAYMPTDKVTVDFFTRKLFFDKNDEAEYFLAAHSIYASEEGFYQFKEAKRSRAHPEEALPVWLSNVVKEKMGDLTPGHVIWGVGAGDGLNIRNLRNWADREYSPSSSFNEPGDQLIVGARDILEQVQAKLDEEPEETPEDDPQLQAANDVTENVIKQTVEAQVTEIATGAVVSERALRRRLATEGGEVISKMVDGESKRLCMNAYLDRQNQILEEREKQEEELAQYNQIKQQWKNSLINSTFEQLITSTVAEAAQNLSSTVIAETWKQRKVQLRSEVVRQVATQLIESELGGILAELGTTVRATLLAERKRKIEEIRQKRRLRLARIAARYWLRETRKSMRKRAVRLTMPKLGGKNIFAKIAEQRQNQNQTRRAKCLDTENIHPDKIRKLWKEKREIQILKRTIKKFDQSKLIVQIAENALRPDPSRLLISVYLQHEPTPALTTYMETKFGQNSGSGTTSGTLHHRCAYGVFFLQFSPLPPTHHYDRVFMIRSNDSISECSNGTDAELITVDLENEFKNCENFEAAFLNVMGEKITSRCFHESMRLVELVNRVIIGTEDTV